MFLLRVDGAFCCGSQPPRIMFIHRPGVFAGHGPPAVVATEKGSKIRGAVRARELIG